MQLQNLYHQVPVAIIGCFVARRYDSFQKQMWLYLGIEWPCHAYHMWDIVDFYKWGLDISNCLEYFDTFAFMANQSALQNCGYWQPWHHVSSSSTFALPSIRTGDQLNEETLGATSAHCQSNILRKSEVSELTRITVDETAFPTLKRQASHSITIVCSQRKTLFVNEIICIVIQLTDTTVHTGNTGLPNCRTSPWHLELLTDFSTYFCS